MKTGSITHIKAKTDRKTNPILVETILLARKNKSWLKLAHKISGSKKDQPSINLSELDEIAKAGETIVVPGKILASGNITKKLKLVALSISSSALAKLKETKSEYLSIADEIKANPKATGVKILWK